MKCKASRSLLLFLSQAAIGVALTLHMTPVHSQSAKPNLVVLVLDQLGADELHCYGNARETSPNIDRLASRGAVLSHFYTVAPWTAPSLASLHTSLYPSRHGVTLFARPGLPLVDKDTQTLAESLGSAGYRAAAFVDGALGSKSLVGNGFVEFVDGGSGAADITARVVTWLDLHHSDPQPFFLYVHLLEPHSPYNPPAEHDLFKSDAYPNLSNRGYDLASGGLLRLATNGDPKAVARLYQLYDGKIHYADRYIGMILDHLRSVGLEDNSYILLTSDHGELLYSHPDDFLTFDHRSLYNSVLHIPFIIAGPGIQRGQISSGLASNLDTAPTLLDLAGARPIRGAEGHSLLPLIQGRVLATNKFVFAEEDIVVPERSVQGEGYKLIRNLWTEHEQLFDVSNDPHELHDVASARPAVAKKLSLRLEQWMRANEPPADVQLRRWKIYTEPNSTVTVDDIAVGAEFLITNRQAWHSDANPASGNYQGTSFWTEPGDGTRTAVWRAENPLIGHYNVFVYVGDPKVGSLATNARFKVVTQQGSRVVVIDLEHNVGEWRPLGNFDNPRYVELDNAANGIVVADAVRFERVQ